MNRDLVEFAYRHRDHQRVIERTPVERWYAEELSRASRCSTRRATAPGDRDGLGWVDEGTGPR